MDYFSEALRNTTKPASEFADADGVIAYQTKVTFGWDVVYVHAEIDGEVRRFEEGAFLRRFTKTGRTRLSTGTILGRDGMVVGGAGR